MKREYKMTHKFWEIYDEYIRRPGADKLKEWLLTTDIAIAPASTRFHGSYAGGLMDHSVHVWEELVRLLRAYPEIKATGETAAIIALGHDFCKLNTYKQELRNSKENGIWVKKPVYVFDEDFCFGSHGGKSVYLIQKHMNLTDVEAVAINCHMSFSDRNPGDFGIGKAYEQYSLAWLLHVADESATFIREV
jgi:hypothetical protein